MAPRTNIRAQFGKNLLLLKILKITKKTTDKNNHNLYKKADPTPVSTRNKQPTTQNKASITVERKTKKLRFAQNSQHRGNPRSSSQSKPQPTCTTITSFLSSSLNQPFLLLSIPRHKHSRPLKARCSIAQSLNPWLTRQIEIVACMQLEKFLEVRRDTDSQIVRPAMFRGRATIGNRPPTAGNDSAFQSLQSLPRLHEKCQSCCTRSHYPGRLGPFSRALENSGTIIKIDQYSRSCQAAVVAFLIPTTCYFLDRDIHSRTFWWARARARAIRCCM